MNEVVIQSFPQHRFLLSASSFQITKSSKQNRISNSKERRLICKLGVISRTSNDKYYVMHMRQRAVCIGRF